MTSWQGIFFCITGPLCGIHRDWQSKCGEDVYVETRYVDGTPTSEVTPVTIRYIRPPHHDHTSQYHGWFTSSIVNRLPHSWDKAISDSDLETAKSMSWVWSKGKVIQSAQYHINSLPFHFTSIRPTIPEIELFWNLSLKHPRSRSWMRSHQSDKPFLRYGQNSVWPWKKNTSEMYKENLSK